MMNKITAAEPIPPNSRASAIPTERRSFLGELAGIIRQPPFVFLCAVAAAFVIFFIRNPGPFFYPTIYAEDGQWAAMVLQGGFWGALDQARPDYYVFGNIALIWLAVKACDIFCGGNLAYLPETCAVVSNLFLSVVISLPILLMRKQLRPRYLFAFWLLAAFVPLGNSDNEVLGRLCNIGFVFLYLGFLLVSFRIHSARSRASFFLADAGLLACAATNPFCFFLVSVTAWPYVRSMVIERRPLMRICRQWSAFSLFFLVIGTGIVAARPLTNERRDKHHVTTELTAFGAIEMGVARNVLYPVIFPVYKHMRASASLLVLAVLCGMMYSYRKSPASHLYGLGAFVLGITSIVLIAKRPELYQFYLGNYVQSFPDRYFYAQNLITLLLLVKLASDWVQDARLPNWSRKLPLLFLPWFFLTIGEQSSFGLPNPLWTDHGTFANSLTTTAFSEAGSSLPERQKRQTDLMMIPIYPGGWHPGRHPGWHPLPKPGHISLPRERVMRTPFTFPKSQLVNGSRAAKPSPMQDKRP